MIISKLTLTVESIKDNDELLQMYETLYSIKVHTIVETHVFIKINSTKNWHIFSYLYIFVPNSLNWSNKCGWVAFERNWV